jgi:gliding motility-associated-like protein
LDVSTDVVLSVPKAFTPNNDNLNDILKIEYGAGIKTLNRFVIFNRYGRIVFQTNDITKGWDGRVNGYDQEMDAYTYLIDYTTYQDKLMKKTGSVILLR